MTVGEIYTVTWLEKYQLPGIEAKSPEEAIEKAKKRLCAGEEAQNIDCFRFKAVKRR